MASLTLPLCSSATLRSFSLVACVSVLLAVALIAHMTGSILLLVTGISSSLALGAVGMLRPHALAFPYRAWNRLAREFSELGRLWVLGACFYLVLVAVGRTGSSLKLHRPEASESLWIPRKAPAPDVYGSQYAAPVSGSPTFGWIVSYLAWTLQTRNYWASWLLPFLILLSALEPERESTISPDLYTLF